MIHPTVEPTYRLIVLVVKALLEKEAQPQAILAAIETMEGTITEAEQQRQELQESLKAIEPYLYAREP